MSLSNDVPTPSQLSHFESEPVIWTVGALCLAIGDAIESRFAWIHVSGEISHVTHASSGHVYFTLKDHRGQMKCALFRQQARQLREPLCEGRQVVVEGQLSVYAPRGDLQLIVQSVKVSGAGDLYERFIQIKSKLAQEGLFDAHKKRQIQTHPRRIGLVTSADGAALHDVMTTLKKNVPHIPVVFSPSLVQGDAAPAQIQEALERLCKVPQVDVVLLVRGGGSIEDLWAFNDERLVRFLAQCPWPIISGVGHETDFTLTDFVSDLRAPTPTAAAQACAKPRADCLRDLERLELALHRALATQINQAHQLLDQCQLSMQQPQMRLQSMHAELRQMSTNLHQGMVLRLQTHESMHAHWDMRLHRVAPQRTERHRFLLDTLAARLDLVHPDRVLQRGFVRISNQQGQVVATVKALSTADVVTAHFHDGKAELMVQQVLKT